MHDFCFHNLERYPQTFWLPSDVPGFDGGFSTPVVPFRWRGFVRSKNRERLPYMYIGNQNLQPPIFVSMGVGVMSLPRVPRAFCLNSPANINYSTEEPLTSLSEKVVSSW